MLMEGATLALLHADASSKGHRGWRRDRCQTHFSIPGECTESDFPYPRELTLQKASGYPHAWSRLRKY